MIIASAQTRPIRNDIEGNLLNHYRLAETAARNGADLILFPEMSITGYERGNASKLAFVTDDTRLDNLRKLSIDNKINIVAGAPIIIEDDLFIGSFIIRPDNKLLIYTKQFLHTGEDLYFKSSFNYNPIFEIKKEKVAIAICADINNIEHVENAYKSGATLYLAGIFFTPNGIREAHKILSEYAKRFSMNVLMSNFSGESWGLKSGGQSGFWNKNGKLISKIDDDKEDLLLVENKDGKWIKKVCCLSDYKNFKS